MSSSSVNTNPPKVFLCHSSKDKAFVEWLAEELESRGLRIWLDKWEIKVGDSIVEKINSGIQTSDYLAVVLSKSSVNSRWVQEEMNAGVIRNVESKGAFILPVLIEDCEIPPLLSHRRYADFRKDRLQGLNEIIDALIPSGETLVKELDRIMEDFDRIVTELTSAAREDTSPFSNYALGYAIMELNNVLEEAVHLRSIYEARTRKFGLDRFRWNRFYEELQFLESLGINLRNRPPWGELRNLRNKVAHPSPEDKRRSYDSEVLGLISHLDDLRKVILDLRPQQ